MKRAYLPVLLGVVVLYNLGLIGVLFLDITPDPAAAVEPCAGIRAHDASTAGGKSIIAEVCVDESVHVGQPFVYEVRVKYDPEAVMPDFRKFLRDVRFVPFEQLHLSRPTLEESSLPSGQREFLLAYQVLGVNVTPHGSYTLDPVVLSYLDLVSNKIKTLAVQPAPVQIAAYYPRDFFGIPFEPLKGAVEAYHEEKLAAITADAILLLVLGIFLVYNAARKRDLQVSSGADTVRQRYEAVQAGTGDDRQRILSYERLFLSLILRYRNLTARGFWLGRTRGESGWDEDLKSIKNDFQTAYRDVQLGKGVIGSIRETFERVFKRLEADSDRERSAKLARLQGTMGQRVRLHKLSLAGGMASLAAGIFFLVLLLKPGVWMNTDAVHFNEWINLIPEKFLDEDRVNELESVDLELLGHASGQHDTMEKLQGEVYKAAYLYNYGTMVAKTNVAILTSANEEVNDMEEEETVEPPSFEFPVQLLANSARFFPYDEDMRRNLELVIMYRENEEKNETGEVQGEVGPPLPGFSRDMNEVQF